MTSTNASTPRARTLSGLLRDTRKQANTGVRQLANRLGVSHATVSRWENGHVVPDSEDVASILACLGITGAERERILALARETQEDDWLTTHNAGVPHQLTSVMELERTTCTMTDWSPLLIPGMLQTANYARAIVGDGAVPRSDVETRVMLRLGRRDALTRSEPLSLLALIGDAAIRGQVGGTKVMTEQLRHLQTMSELAALEVRIVPLCGGWHPGLMGPFTFYEFPDLPEIVHLEHHRSSVFLHNGQDVAAYREVAGTLDRVAMDKHESQRVIAARLAELENE